MANDYGKYQLSLKRGDVMINVSGVDREEFAQRVKDAKKILDTEFPVEKKGEIPFDEIPFAEPFNEPKKPPLLHVACPFCKSECWDNRDSKKTPKHPDFKCKDKECGAAAWIDNKSGQPRWKKG